MTLTLTNARLIDPERGTEDLGTVLIEDGRITKMVYGGNPDLDLSQAIDCEGQCLAPGIIDIGVKVSEPGERQKESFRTAGLAAAAGGVTTIVTRPDTDPPIDTPEMLQFQFRRANSDSLVRVLPMACLTKGRLGGEMTEIGFLKDAGAVAFTDADRPVASNKVLTRALSYAASMDALVIGHAQDANLSAGACVTSGAFAVKQGLPSVSPVAERLQIDRDLALVRATGVRYHIDQISTEMGLDALRRARREGTKVTAGASVHHLTLNEFDVGDYRTFFKLKPPLRAEDDRLAIVAALGDGEIDIISSMHTPQDEESKRLPFEEAASGAVALETLLPATLRLVHAGQISLGTLFKALSLNPAKLLGLPQGRMEVGAPADLILFNPNTPYVLDRGTLRSKSKNTPFDLQRMQGRVLKTFLAGKEIFSHGEPHD